MKKVVLITGASAGIGEATAIALRNQGHVVYGGARRVEKMKNIARYGVKPLALDVSNEESMQRCIQQVLSEQGRIDVLVNNAGYGAYGSLEDTPLAEGKRQFEVNLFGLARMTQLALPHMREHRYGRIINISSIGGRVGSPHGTWYQASKFAVEGFSDSLRMELRQFGIDVVIIEPGAIKTEWSGIAQDNLIKTSGHTVYGNLATQHAHNLAKYDGSGSTPNVIADTIVQAVEARRPRTRYAVGRGTGMLLLARRILSDRLLDRFMLRMLTA